MQWSNQAGGRYDPEEYQRALARLTQAYREKSLVKLHDKVSIVAICVDRELITPTSGF